MSKIWGSITSGIASFIETLSGTFGFGTIDDGQHLIRSGSLIIGGDFTESDVPAGAIIIREKADFPAPSAGVITLATFGVYYVAGSIDLGTDVLEGDNVTIKGSSTFLTEILTASASPLFSTATATGILILIDGMSLTNTVGDILDVETLNAGVGSFVINTVLDGRGTGSAGQLVGAKRVDLSRLGIINCMDGVKITGTVRDVAFSNVSLEPVSGATSFKGVEITASANITTMVMNVCRFINANAADISLSISPSATLDREIRVNTSEFIGPGDYIDPAGLQKSDVGLIVANSTGVEDSVYSGSIYFTDNTDPTAIAVTGTSYPIGQGQGAGHTTYTLEANSERFELNGEPNTEDQALMFKGKETRPFLALATLATDKVSGGTITAGACILKNGTPIASSVAKFDVANRGTAMVTMGQLSLSTDDEVSICVSNESTTVNLEVLSAKLQLFWL